MHSANVAVHWRISFFLPFGLLEWHPMCWKHWSTVPLKGTVSPSTIQSTYQTMYTEPVFLTRFYCCSCVLYKGRGWGDVEGACQNIEEIWGRKQLHMDRLIFHYQSVIRQPSWEISAVGQYWAYRDKSSPGEELPNRNSLHQIRRNAPLQNCVNNYGGEQY